jgi:hypothetical protein
MHARARASFKIGSLKPEARQSRIAAFSLPLTRREFITLLDGTAAWRLAAIGWLAKFDRHCGAASAQAHEQLSRRKRTMLLILRFAATSPFNLSWSED